MFVFRRKYVRPESPVTAEHKWHKLTFDPIVRYLTDLLEKPNECSNRVFPNNAQHLIDSFLSAKLTPQLKRSINLAHLESGIYDKTEAQLERESQLNNLESDGRLPLPTMTATLLHETSWKNEQLNVVCFNCKYPRQVIGECYKRTKRSKNRKLTFTPKCENVNVQHICTLSTLPGKKSPYKKMLEWSECR